MKKPSPADFSLVANTLRGLAIDAIQKANSGHPGVCLGMADIAAVLWLGHLRHDPVNPAWPDRDRFVLSGGHGSALLYSLLHVAGYDLSLDDLKGFRQFGTRTPGHPERGLTPGVEATTGPLGQGLANAVGMAAAERMLAARVNADGRPLVDHYTYVFCGDGDLMEGISHEVAPLAALWKLEKLVVFSDSNHITIEGDTAPAQGEDVAARFKAYGWRVLSVDGHDVAAIDKAIAKARRPGAGAPTLVVCRTEIGHGSPHKAGTAAAHGEPLGVDELALTKQALGLPAEPFFVPEEVRALFAARLASLRRQSRKWFRVRKEAFKADPALAALWKQHFDDELPKDIESRLPVFEKPVATRAASGKTLQALAAALPQLVGGSADLAPSNKTWLDAYPAFSGDDPLGRNFHFGIRELGSAAICAGIVLHGGLRPFCATFFTFSDYMRPAIRVAALSKLPVIYVFTHDSFYVGEDGPTHEPVEQLAAFRAMPGVTVLRPSDPAETAQAWLAALRNREGPTLLLLTRQNLEVIDRTRCAPAESLAKGAYTLWQRGEGKPDLLLLASGSEVSLALKAAEAVPDANIRVVAMPSWELFERQSQAYRDRVLPPECTRRLALEAGASFGWERYVGDRRNCVALDAFGASGPYKALEMHYGLTPDAVAARIRTLLMG